MKPQRTDRNNQNYRSYYSASPCSFQCGPFSTRTPSLLELTRRVVKEGSVLAFWLQLTSHLQFRLVLAILSHLHPDFAPCHRQVGSLRWRISPRILFPKGKILHQYAYCWKRDGLKWSAALISIGWSIWQGISTEQRKRLGRNRPLWRKEAAGTGWLQYSNHVMFNF